MGIKKSIEDQPNPAQARQYSFKRVKKMNCLFILLQIFFCIPIFAQKDTSASFFKHTISPSFGRGTTFINNNNLERSRSFGLDYAYALNSNWQIALQLDFTFNNSFSQFQSHSMAIAGAYYITDPWEIMGGIGFENDLRLHQLAALYRVGTEYCFYFGPAKRFGIEPGIVADLVQREWTISGVIAFNFSF